MFDPANRESTPQFGTAEYAGVAGELRCHFCKQPTPQQYYRVGTVTACGTCAEIARQQMPHNTTSAFVKALVLGMGAALVGLVGYAALVIILRGWTIGYIAVGVGYIVGKAMMFGSKGAGGQKFQIAAALLTYAAISMAEIPIRLMAFRHYDYHPDLDALLWIHGLASPFFDLGRNLVWGAIGLVIIFVGMQIAWRITAGRPNLEVFGPFDSGMKPA